MANSIIRGKKTTSARQKKLLIEHCIDEMDLAFCDLVLAGWSERLAAYYAYSLTADNDSSIDTFVRNQKHHHPGILTYLKCAEEEKQKSMRELQSKAVEIQQAKRTMAVMQKDYDLMTKQGMLDYLVDLSNTPGLDVKTKTDLAKQISDLMQFKKEEIKEEDNRINFYLPVTCRYCNKCDNCKLKSHVQENCPDIKIVKEGTGYSIAENVSQK